MDCNICLQKYNAGALTPRILPSCGHTLCEECGVKLLVNGQLTCPFDRMVNVVADGSIQNLPKNFAILELLENLENAPAPNPAPANPESIDDEISVEEYMYNWELEEEDDEIFLQECIYNSGLGGHEEAENAPAPDGLHNDDVTLKKHIVTELLTCLRKLYDLLCTFFSPHPHSE